MEDEVKYQKEEGIKVTVVLRLRYRKPVNPSCDIVEMSWNVWHKFLRASHKDSCTHNKPEESFTHHS